MKPAFRAWTRAAAALLAALALLALPGCALLRHRAPAPPRPAPGYEGLRDTLAAVDASGLAGRRIVLDPGHGGFFRGALGVHGLAEAEVNLGVARKLRDLLAAHGAQVLLTRDTDRDFLTPADSSLRADLAARARAAAAFAPDLFVSIHHNADARGAHDINETQTYYKLGDEGPSLDVAQDVHRALVRNVGIATNKVVPGNFYVLRTSEAPAILTETSYITDPDVEALLAEPEKQQLEADAIFIGLARYFARRVPVIEEFVARDPEVPGERATFVRGNPTLSGTIRGSFDAADLVVDGARATPMRGDSVLWWRPPVPWKAGHHEATLAVRLAAEGTSRGRSLSFDVTPPWSGVEVLPFGDASLDAAHPVLALRLRGYDSLGRLMRDTTSLHVRFSGTAGVAPAETTIAMRDGVGWAYLRARRPLAPGASSPLMVVMEAQDVGHSWVQLTIGATGEQGPRPWTGFARRMPENVPLAGAPGTEEPEPRNPWLNRDGFAVLPRDTAGLIRVPVLPGYRSWPADSALPPQYVAIANGALHGRRITLDPEGGGEDAAGQGPGGTRAAFLNLESARTLAGFLRAAGAEVLLTREGDLALSEVERVQRSEAFHADRFLRIGHRAGPARLGYFSSSASGKAWAGRTAETCAALGLPSPAIGEEAQYALQQTSCPSLYASPSSLGSEAAEARILAPGALRAEAYALFLTLVREWSSTVGPLDTLIVRDTEGRAAGGAAVVLGGAIVLTADASGRIVFARTEPGPILVEVEDPRVRARAILLESDRSAVLTGPPGR